MVETLGPIPSVQDGYPDSDLSDEPGAVENVQDVGDATLSPTPLACPDCGRTFASKQGLGRHRTVTHPTPEGKKAKERRARVKAAATTTAAPSIVADPQKPESWSATIARLESEVERTRLAHARTVAILAQCRYAQALYDTGAADDALDILGRL